MHSTLTLEPKLYGVVAEFETPEQLLDAANAAREAGYTELDAYTPFPVHGMSEAIGFHDEKVPWVFFIFGVLGFLTGWALQIGTNVIDYPLNVGGKPFLSWPAYFPVAYECTILFSGVGGVFTMIGMNGLPKPYHPVFEAQNFDRATQDRFFLAIEAKDPKFDEHEVEAFLATHKPLSLSVVEDED